MFSGLILVLLGGSLWAALGIVTACGKEHNAPIELVQPFAGILILLFAGWTIFSGTPFPLDCSGLILTLIILAVGACNYFMLNLVQVGMRSGREGVVWAFSQSAMITPFIMGIVFFHEPVSLFRIGGLVLILTALILFSIGRKSGNVQSGGWLAPTLAAFLLVGLAQSLASLPSYFQLSGLTPLRRMILLQIGIVLAFFTDHLIRREKADFHNREAWIFGTVFGAANLIALIFFYSGQNLLADSKCASISYPAGQGISIALVFLFSSFRNSPGRLAIFAFFLLLFGLVFLGI